MAYSRLVPCEACQGQGGKRVACPTCGGRGVVETYQRGLFGTFVSRTPCPHCKGQGFLLAEACPVCRGRGRVPREERVRVRIPPGMDEGHLLRVPGYGNLGPGGPGDLYVRLSVLPHPHLEREGPHLVYRLKLGLAQAALGARVEVPGLSGPIPLDIPPGTATERSLSFPGRAFPTPEGGGPCGWWWSFPCPRSSPPRPRSSSGPTPRRWARRWPPRASGRSSRGSSADSPFRGKVRYSGSL